MEIFRLAVDLDEIVISSYDKIGITIRCASDVPRYQSILGPTRLTIPKGCSLETPEWVVSGINRGSSSVHIPAAKYRQLPKLNLSWPHAPHTVVLRQLNLKQQAEGSAVDVRGWTDADLDDVVWPFDIGTWIYVGVGVAVGVILLVYIGVWVLYVPQMLKGFRKYSQEVKGTSCHGQVWIWSHACWGRIKNGRPATGRSTAGSISSANICLGSVTICLMINWSYLGVLCFVSIWSVVWCVH